MSNSVGTTSKVDSYMNSESHFTTETQVTRKTFGYLGSMGFAPEHFCLNTPVSILSVSLPTLKINFVGNHDSEER